MPRILIVDDDSFMLKLLARMLESLGFSEVIACDGGLIGLQQLATGAPAVDVVFLDINMPGMDGIEFIRRLVECRYSGSVVLVSGENSRILDSVEKLVQVHKLWLLGSLQKPVARGAVADLMKQLRPNAPAQGAASAEKCPYAVEQLRSAVANGELICHYQPKVSMKTGEVVGAESLVRWQPPQGALIFPQQFIPLAEEHGLMSRITHAVLRSAMKQAKLWRRRGRNLSIAVNVSMSDLAALDFPDTAAAMAHAIGIEPSAITFEVTESQVMKQLSTVLDVLSRLQLKRFKLSIDDFGTGHSSLAQLRDLPFDELKIDRGFVHGASSNSTVRAICSASLRMAQQLGLQVVAEGIEQAQDWVLLRDLGCDVGQGYLIARPMPVTDLDQWMTNWEAQLGTAAGLPH
jgi:EAL domain-containing protein (putative c-di-GMP-specific phosphodiesterase class I)/CheY-like chemotaxis protein